MERLLKTLFGIEDSAVNAIVLRSEDTLRGNILTENEFIPEWQHWREGTTGGIIQCFVLTESSLNIC